MYAVLVLQRQVLVADVALLLEFKKSGLALFEVFEQADYPNVFPPKTDRACSQSSSVMKGLASSISPVSAFSSGVRIVSEPLEYPAIAKLGQFQCTLVRHEAPSRLIPNVSCRQKQKANMAEHPKAFGHVGLLFNEPPGKAKNYFIQSSDNCCPLYSLECGKRNSPLSQTPSGGYNLFCSRENQG